MIHSGRIRQVRLVMSAGSPTIIGLRLLSLAQALDDMGFPAHSGAILELMNHVGDRHFIMSTLRVTFSDPADADAAIAAIFTPMS